MSPEQPEGWYGDRLVEVFITEVVWDPLQDELAEEGRVPRQRMAVHVGPQRGWQPAHVLTLAAASCFMRTLFLMADDAGVPILGYVWKSKLRVLNDAG